MVTAGTEWEVENCDATGGFFFFPFLPQLLFFYHVTLQLQCHLVAEVVNWPHIAAV